MRRIQRKPRYRINKGPCPFCEGEADLDYKNPESLSKFISDRGKILGRSRTGVCQKHQKRLAKAVKRARHLGMMRFVS